MRAATYVRESTREQAEGFPPDAQRRALVQYAETHGIEIVATFEDYESGTHEARHGFQEMLAAADSGSFDIILCFHTSRFARDAEVARRAKRSLRRKGIRVVALNLPSLDPDSPEGFLLEGISEVLDEHYSKQLGWWTRHGLKEAWRQGKFIGSTPVGYERGDGGRLVLSEMAPLIRSAFGDYADGLVSTPQLARSLAQAGLRTARGKPLSVSGVRVVLQNRTYWGLVKYKGEERPGDVEPLIDLETFEAVQQKLRERHSGASSPRRYRTYVLGSLLRCANCNARWYGHSWKKLTRYRCYGPGERRCSGEIRSVLAEDLERQVEEKIIAHLSIDEPTKAAVVESLRGRQPEYGRERAKLEQRLARLRDLYELGDVPREQYLEGRDSIRSQLATMPPIPLPIHARDVLEELSGLAARWRDLAPAAQQALLRVLLKEIVVQDGVITAIQPRPECMAVVANLTNSRPPAPSRG